MYALKASEEIGKLRYVFVSSLVYLSKSILFTNYNSVLFSLAEDPCKANRKLCSKNSTCESIPLPSGRLGHHCYGKFLNKDGYGGIFQV